MMKYFVWITAFALVCTLFGVSSASASNAEVLISAAGGAYNGLPRLRLLANGRLIGERPLAKSIDTTNGLKITKANRRHHQEWQRFKVPAIERVTSLEIEFTNEAWAGKGRPGKRYLIVYKLIVDGYQFRPTFMKVAPASAGGTYRDYNMLWSKGRLQLARPEKGWRSGYKVLTPEK